MSSETRSVIITGGAKGIGSGCVRVFAKAGWSVAILDRDQSAAEELASDINSEIESRIAVFACDVSQPTQLKAAIDAAATRFGRLDCLVNNAGVHPPATRIEDTSLDDLAQVMQINFVSTFAGVQFALPHLRKTKGTVVIMSSMTAVLGQDQSSAYASTKGAQLSLTKALAKELGPEGIRVNAILPSNIDTPLMREWAATLPDPKSALDRVAGLQVLGRMGTSEEIGEVALFLASDASSFITGQGIWADGGASLDY
ncbi:SDR family NAD(P)-dependent oxidoreductase [Thalassoroseus pseudoceratinae]|uniref:SDR family NAD(P)-dependent oxidoreductase n=1 Tax=Thalassoroseus pseudoceratinae TaxID=2713176 RepID=UPI00141E8BEC|nr:glucose 1-dehydrogenase [Thalassoroseus pseudoceratinae]